MHEMSVHDVPSQQHEGTVANGASAPGHSVLVVDDDAAVRSSIRRSLESHGYEVAEASNSREAREVFESVLPDLVLMDLILPNGLEGREAANMLFGMNPNLKVLFISGYSSPEPMRMGRLTAGEGFLRKPFELHELLEAVGRLLGGSGTPPAPGG